MHSLAPIGFTVYTRLSHLIKSINSLRSNSLATSSDLFIFSDGPEPGDDAKVKQVRDYLYGIDGFKTITIIERQTNSRIENNRGGQRYLLEKFEKMIWLADDIVPAPGFLEFMNSSLVFYENDPNILSITGYCPPIDIPSSYKADVFAMRRFSAWGFGIWKRKYDLIGEIPLEEYYSLMESPLLLKKLSECGSDIIRMVKRDAKKEINAYDVRAMYYQFLHDMFTIYPSRSLTQNIGFDGSGVHCGVTNRFDVDLWDKVDDFELVPGITPDEDIVLANRKFRG